MLTEPWILLRLRVRASGIWADYEDDQGIRYSSKSASLQEWQSVALASIRQDGPFLLPLPRVDFFTPTALRALLAQKTFRLRSQPTSPETGLPAPLPVFLSTPPALSVFSWETVLAKILQEDVQVVRLARSRNRWRPRSPFRLPLRVQTIGDISAGSRLLEPFQAHDWVKLEDVQRFGVQISSSELLLELPPESRSDIVLCDASEAVGVLRRISRLKDVESRPRLVFVTSPSNPELVPLLVSLHKPTQGTSIIWASTPTSPELVDKLLYAVLHDQPLHEAVKRVSTRSLTPFFPILVSDPAGVEDLRMTGALGEFVEESAELESRLLPGDVEAFLQRALPDCPPQLEKAMRNLDLLAHPMQKAVDAVNILKVDFGRETSSMVHIAKSRGDLSRARESEEQLVQILRSISTDAESRAAIAKHQERRVDVALRRLDRSPFPRPWVMPDETLRRGARYRIRVHVGRSLKLSLVTDEVPALDPLLPELPDEGAYLLHVALYGLDFKALSETLLPLRLPQLGGSDPVSFDVVAPWSTGQATLRIAVYYDLPAGSTMKDGRELPYHNYLIQTFLLKTQVEEEEQQGVKDGTRVHLEFSQTERFTNLPALTPRFLSLGLNDGPGSATHTLMAKRGAQKEEIHLEETVLGEQLTRVREQLDTATWNDTRKAARFPETSADPGREADFDRAIRNLARAGKDLYDRVWQDASEGFQGALDDVRESVDKVVQVVRFAQNYLFPWSVFYDFALSPSITGAPERDVCHGFQRRNPDATPFSCQQCLSQCLHPDKKEAFCVYGFWGIRHQVEQILHTPNKREDSISRLGPVRKGAVGIGVGLDGGLGAELPGSLVKRVGEHWVRELTAAMDILDELWADDRRPAILVLLSHYETQDKPGQAIGPRFTLPGGKWLQPRDLLNRAQTLPYNLRKWKEPNPVILLAACESAGADLGALASYLGAFADSRAAAVVGTEVVVFEGIASRFSQEIAADLLEGKSLGEAMLRFRRSLLQQLNPLGLVFTPYGSADLARPKGELR